jgi:hypothetical protein
MGYLDMPKMRSRNRLGLLVGLVTTTVLGLLGWSQQQLADKAIVSLI